MAWRTQFSNLLFSYDLLLLICGSSSYPIEHLFSSIANSLISNPGWMIWKCQDNFIHQTIIGFFSPTVTSRVTPSVSFADAWMKIDQNYANKFHTRMLSLREALLKVKKDGLFIDDYIQNIKQIYDDLALIGNPMNDDELINGIGSKYRQICAAIQAID